MKTNSLWKTSLIGVCLLASWQADAKDYYLAPGGTGNGMAIDKPFGDPIKAFAALKAGDVLYVICERWHLSSLEDHQRDADGYCRPAHLCLRLSR